MGLADDTISVKVASLRPSFLQDSALITHMVIAAHDKSDFLFIFFRFQFWDDKSTSHHTTTQIKTDESYIWDYETDISLSK